MKRRNTSILVAAVLVLLIPRPVRAVVGTAQINLVGTPGPVEVTFTPQDPAQGPPKTITAEVGKTVKDELEEGSYDVTVKGRNVVKKTTEMTVTPGKTTSKNLQVLGVSGWMVQNPGGVFGGFLVGPFGIFQRTDLDIDDETERIFVNGTQVAVFKNQSPNRFKMKMGGGGLDLAAGLPGFSAFGWSFSPAVNGVIGGTRVTLENPATRFKLTGNGIQYGGGVELAGVPSSLPAFYLATGWQGWWMKADDLEAEVAGQDVCSLFVVAVCRLREEVRSRNHEVFVRGGYGVLQGRLVPFLGVKLRWTRVERDSDLRLIDPGMEVRDKINIDFKRKTSSPVPMGIAGFDFRGPDIGSLGRVFGRLQAQFDNEGVDV
ncbi:MAG: hypothetical protein ACREQ7_24560, partial [Candidatus Binatia bacterium]